MIQERIETIVIARMATSARALPAVEIAKQLYRFAPSSTSDVAWRERVAGIVEALGAIESPRDALVKRLGKHGTRTWQQYVERVFPALALGVAADDTKAQSKLVGRDAWTAAIAARALGLWSDGAPPTLPAACDAFAWRQLGLVGKPKRCPPEVRAVFFQRELGGVDAGPPERMVRLYAAAAVGAPRAEIKALRDALVRCWLEGRVLGDAASFADEVRDVARAARDGVFGDRKVFISSVWDELRRHPQWSSLTLDDFKARLVRAHREGDVELARADLVGTMNPDLVAASETSTGETSFHFIVREEPS